MTMPGRLQPALTQYIDASPTNCSVEDWECIRATAYITDPGSLGAPEASAYTAHGFEMGLHVDTGCADWGSYNDLAAFYADQLGDFSSHHPYLPAPVTERTHCVAWGDYDTQPRVEFNYGIRLDTNYYYWPGSWIDNRPGFFTGSGMPMRFTRLDGTLIDVYQAATQMTDESDQTYPYTINTLLDNAIGLRRLLRGIYRKHAQRRGCTSPLC